MSEIEITNIKVNEPDFFQSLSNKASYEVSPTVDSILLSHVNAFTSLNFNSVSFKIDPQPQALVIKANPLKFNFSFRMLAKIIDNRTSGFSTSPLTDECFCLSQFSLLRICNNINLNFNGCNYSLNNVDRMINAMSLYHSLEELNGNSVQVDNACVANFSELTQTNNAVKYAVNPFMDYGYSDKFISRRCYVTRNTSFNNTANSLYQGLIFSNGYSAATATGGNAYQILDANVELTIPLELFNNDHTSFANVSSLQFDFNFNNMLSKLVSFNTAAAGTFAKNTTTETGETVTTNVNNVTFNSISSCEFVSVPFMSYYRVQMSQNLVRSLKNSDGSMKVIPYKITKFNVVSAQTTECDSGQSISVNFPSNTYQYVPKKIFIYAIKNYMASTNVTSGQLSTTPANFGVINDLKLYVNNSVINYDSAKLNDLYHLSEKNHLNTSYCSLYQFKNGQVGTVVCIDTEDLPLLNSYGDKPEVVNISCNLTIKNPGNELVNFTPEMVMCNDSILLLGQTTASILDGLDINQRVTETIDDHYSNYSNFTNIRLGGRIIGGAMHASHHLIVKGGGFFKDLGKELIRWVNKLSGPLSMIFPEFSTLIGGVKTVANEIGDRFLQGSGIKKVISTASKVKFKGV